MFFSAADGATLMGDAVRLRAQAGSTDDILQALASDVAGTFGSTGGSAVDREYAEDKRRMLDAESVAIRHIVRESLAVLRAEPRAAI